MFFVLFHVALFQAQPAAGLKDVKLFLDILYPPKGTYYLGKTKFLLTPSRISFTNRPIITGWTMYRQDSSVALMLVVSK